MVDAVYVRGWQDCLEVVDLVLEKAKTVDDVKIKMQQLQKLVKENKFEKIRYELGAFDVF
jgi:predicted nucleotidyltransferase